MIKINKGKKPSFLNEHLDITWESFRNNYRDDYQRLKEILFEEQHSCCAFCETYVKDENNLRNVEHLIDKEYGQQYVFSWENLVGVCRGNSNDFINQNGEENIESYVLSSPDNLHCDKYKDEVKKGNLKDKSKKLFTHALISKDFLTPLSKELTEFIFDIDRRNGFLIINKKIDDEQIKRKAENTINIFNLNNLILTKNRHELTVLFYQEVEKFIKSDNIDKLKLFINEWIKYNGRFKVKGFITTRRVLAKGTCKKLNIQLDNV